MISKAHGITGVIFFFIGHILGDLVWYSAISVAVGKGRKFFSNRTYKILVGVCAVFLFGFAAWLVITGIGKVIG